MIRPTQQVPRAVKIGYTIFCAILVPAYTWHYGVGNFLWFSNIALLLGLVATLLDHRLLASMQAVSVALVEMVWIVGFVLGLVHGGEPIFGLTAYMFDEENPLGIRALSLYHLVLPFYLVWLVWRLGYDRRAFIAQSILGCAVIIACMLFTDPERNINWVFGPGDLAQDWPAAWRWIWVAVPLAGFPLLIFWPTHRVLMWLIPRLGGEVVEANRV